MKQELYCPRCGYNYFKPLFGGCCEFRCGRCGFACNCNDPLSGGFVAKSKPLRKFEHAEEISRVQKEWSTT